MWQQKGKYHITVRAKVANHIWEQNDFKIKWEVALQEAFRRHRALLIKDEEELKKIDPYYERNRAQRFGLSMKDTTKIPIPPRIDDISKFEPPPIPYSALNG